MFGWFKKDGAATLTFTDNFGAFEYACSNLPNLVLLEAVIPALVEEEGRRGRDGERSFRIRLAASGGGRTLWSNTLAEATDWPEIGDLVGFRVVSLAEDVTADSLPIGYIAYVLKPVLAGRKGWLVARNLTPANIRQPFRL